MESDQKYLVQLRLIAKNFRLSQALNKKGMNQTDLAIKLGWPYSRLQQIINLKKVPSLEQQAAIATILEEPIDYLFPESLLSAIKAKVFDKRTRKLEEPEVISLERAADHLQLSYDGAAEIEATIDREFLSDEILELLEELPRFEREVLRCRFGLDDGRAKTLEEVTHIVLGASGHPITRERVRQAEVKALHKLRHPSRSKKLRKFLRDE